MYFIAGVLLYSRKGQFLAGYIREQEEDLIIATIFIHTDIWQLKYFSHLSPNMLKKVCQHFDKGALTDKHWLCSDPLKERRYLICR